MENLRNMFHKFGGLKLIRQYSKAGVLLYALVMSPLLGYSRKGLELLRLVLQMKTYNKLNRKYSKIIAEFDKGYLEIQYGHVHEKKIWICWLQGMENAPLVVQRCYESIHKFIVDYEIVVLTECNIFDYISFPSYILDKWKKGIITNTHFSDLLRLAILNKYGGTWLDATVLCTSSNIPSYILESDLFFFQVLKPGKDGSTLNASSWLLTAHSNNKILMAVQYLLYEYWKTNNSMVDYFLIHYFMEMACNYYRDEASQVIKFCNSIPHILLLDFFEPYDEEKFSAIKALTPFHKLAYKRDESDMKKTGTYFDVVIKQGRY